MGSASVGRGGIGSLGLMRNVEGISGIGWTSVGLGGIGRERCGD